MSCPFRHGMALSTSFQKRMNSAAFERGILMPFSPNSRATCCRRTGSPLILLLMSLGRIEYRQKMAHPINHRSTLPGPNSAVRRTNTQIGAPAHRSHSPNRGMRSTGRTRPVTVLCACCASRRSSVVLVNEKLWMSQRNGSGAPRLPYQWDAPSPSRFTFSRPSVARRDWPDCAPWLHGPR